MIYTKITDELGSVIFDGTFPCGSKFNHWLLTNKRNSEFVLEYSEEKIIDHSKGEKTESLVRIYELTPRGQEIWEDAESSIVGGFYG